MLYLVTPIYRLFVLVLDILDFMWGSYWDIVKTVLAAILPQSRASIRNKNVLITGTANGVGKCLAEEFCRQGANVICWDVEEGANRDVVNELGRVYNVQVSADTVDVSNRLQVNEAARKALDQFGHIDVLVNNAGIMPTRRFLNQPPEEIQKTFDINVMGSIWVLQAVLPDMYRRGAGSVVAVSSCCGVMGSPNLVPYCASKYAVRGLMEALTEEERFYNPNRRPSLHHLTVFPFLINTRMLERPRTRIPWLLPILTPQYVAQEIVSSIRARDEVLFFPKWIYPLFLFSRVWPRRMQQRFYDIVDSGVDEKRYDAVQCD